jgi:hypothetical protein
MIFEPDQSNDFLYSCIVNKPRVWLDQTLSWCQQEIQFEWRWQLVRPSNDKELGVYKFYFSDQRDLLAFVLMKETDCA